MTRHIRLRLLLVALCCGQLVAPITTFAAVSTSEHQVEVECADDIRPMRLAVHTSAGIECARASEVIRVRVPGRRSDGAHYRRSPVPARIRESVVARRCLYPSRRALRAHHRGRSPSDPFS